MKLQKILSRFLKLHPKEIDLSLDRILNLCEKLGNPQEKIKAINVVGTNGKNSTIQACYSILKEANIKCNVYTSPHIQKINERFVFNNQELKDDELADLFEEVEKVNNNQPITFFEILTACYFYKAAQYPENINLVESGLFFRFDATNILKKNLATIITSISKDHLDWLPKNDQTIEKIVFEKTSNLLNSNIIVAKQNQNTMNYIKRNISKNQSNKIFFNEDFSFTNGENGYFYYSRYEEGKEYAIYCRKKGSIDAKEQIILDGNELAKGYDYFSVGSRSVSPNNEWLAYGLDTLSRRFYTIYFKNLPSTCLIKIFTVTGKLVTTIDFNSSNSNGSGQFDWHLTNSDGNKVAPGLYIYHVESNNGEEKIGKFAVIR